MDGPNRTLTRQRPADRLLLCDPDSPKGGVDMGVVSLIVMEPGSLWPGRIRDSENLVAAGYDAEGLLERARRTVQTMRRQRDRVRVAVLACNEATDVASCGRRAEIARELLRAVATVTHGRLVLWAAERASADLRRDLLSLAGRLAPELSGTLASVSLRFGVIGDGEPS